MLERGLSEAWDRIEVFTDGAWRDLPRDLDVTLVRRIDHDDELRTEHGGVIGSPWRAWSGNRPFASSNTGDVVLA